jgi:type I restriction enzyme S subunit
MNAIENISLSKVGELRMGETIIEKDCTGEGLPIYSADKSNRPWAYSTHFKRLNQYGTIVLGARGTIGYPRLPKEAVFGATQTTITLRPDSEKFVPEFIYYALQQLDFSLLSAQQAIPMLTVGNLEAVSVPRYPYPEQSKITEVLSKVDQAIEQTEYLIAKQQRIKTGLMQDLLTRGIDEHGNLRSEETHEFKDSSMGRIPVEWEIKRLEEMAEKIVDGVHHTPTYVDHGMPFLVITDLTAGPGISFENTRYITAADHRTFSARANPAAGDVLVTKDGTLGVARVVKSEYPEFSIFVSLAMIRPRKDYCLPELICFFFDSGEFLIQLGALSAGTGLSHIHLEHFRKFQLRRPPLEEQKIIIDIIKQQELSLTDCHNDLIKLKRLKNAMMQDLLTGKKRVTPLMENMEVCS